MMTWDLRDMLFLNEAESMYFLSGRLVVESQCCCQVVARSQFFLDGYL